MIYPLLIIVLVLLLAFFIYKWQCGDRRATAALRLSSILAAVFFLLRTPALLLNILMLLPALLPLFKKRGKTYRNVSEASATMTPKEARQILGVGENASKEEIMSAFKRLMLKNHPDQGGSQYIAEQLIRAKDLLV